MSLLPRTKTGGAVAAERFCRVSISLQALYLAAQKVFQKNGPSIFPPSWPTGDRESIGDGENRLGVTGFRRITLITL